MTPTVQRTAMLVLMAALVIAFGVIHHQAKAISKLRAESASARVQNAAVEERLKALEASATDSSASVGTVSSAAGIVTSHDAREKDTADPGALDPEEEVRSEALGTEALTMSIRATLDQRYGRLFRMLRLSPNELSVFRELLVERDLTNLRTSGVFPGSGDRHEDMIPGLKTLTEVGENIETVLGKERTERFAHFLNHVEEYTTVDVVQLRLSYGSEPLQESQIEPFVAILAQHRPKDELSSGNFDVFGREQMRVLSSIAPAAAAFTMDSIPDQAIAAASAILTPGQVAVLRQIQQERAEQQNLLMTVGTNVSAEPAVDITSSTTIEAHSPLKK